MEKAAVLFKERLLKINADIENSQDDFELQ